MSEFIFNIANLGISGFSCYLAWRAMRAPPEPFQQTKIKNRKVAKNEG